jgi:hypothetical protein
MSLVVVGVFAVSIPVAFASVLAAQLIWVATLFVGRQVVRRLTPAP